VAVDSWSARQTARVVVPREARSRIMSDRRKHAENAALIVVTHERGQISWERLPQRLPATVVEGFLSRSRDARLV